MVEFRNRGQIRLLQPFSSLVRFNITTWGLDYGVYATLGITDIKCFRGPDIFGVVNGIGISLLYGETKLSLSRGIWIFSNMLHVTAERPRLYDRLISRES